MEDGKFNQTVKNEVEKRLDQNEIKHIISQIKKLSVILGIVGVGLIILGLIATNFSIFTAIYYFIFGLIYLVLAVFLFTKKTKTLMFITGLTCLILGLFSALIPLLVGISLLYYYNKYNKLLKKEKTSSKDISPAFDDENSRNTTSKQNKTNECANCQTENIPKAKFCENCGWELKNE